MALGITKQGRLNNSLYEAVENHDLDAVKQAIKDGAQAHSEEQRAFTTALHANCFEIGAYLIDIGANPNIVLPEQNGLKRSALYHCVENNYIEFVRLLVSNEKTKLNCSGYIVTRQGDRRILNNNTETPLGLSEQKQFIEICFLLAKEDATRLQAKTDIAHAKSVTYEKIIKSQQQARHSMNQTLPRRGISKLGQ